MGQKYFIDCEFLEGDVPIKFLGYNIPKWLIKPNNTIQPISIGLVSSDGREYYAISKDFNLKEAWNRYDEVLNRLPPHDTTVESEVLRARNAAGFKKVYWIRENVLKPIFNELFYKSLVDKASFVRDNYFTAYSGFTYGHLKALINYYGKTNKEIAEEVKHFCSMDTAYSTMDKAIADVMYFSELNSEVKKTIEDKKLIHVFSEIPEFYAYFADYDWVLFLLIYLIW